MELWSGLLASCATLENSCKLILDILLVFPSLSCHFKLSYISWDKYLSNKFWNYVFLCYEIIDIEHTWAFSGSN